MFRPFQISVRKLTLCLGLMLTASWSSQALHAQAISVNGGSIQGSITDPSGAKVPGASLTISNPDTGFTKTLTTDSSGFFSLGPLNPGPYRVVITAPGFETTRVSTVVRTGTVSSGDYKLTLGQSSEVVEVNAGAIQVNTEQAGVSDVVTQEQLQTLPVNGRNFLDIAQIEPGVILQSGSSFDPTKSGYSAISIGGVSGRTTRILLDGQDITDEFVGTTIFNVSEGSIGEFQLNRSNQDISGDVTSTGQVLVSTKSGTNTVHGEAFYNFQDYRALFANGNFGNANPQFQRNQYGGSVGGPIIKDKLFFFANSERIQQAQSAPVSLGPIFAGAASSFGTTKSVYGSPYKEVYSAARLDYNGPFHGHYFVRANDNFNGSVGNFGAFYSLYTNRDNTYGITGGADFAPGRFTYSLRGGYEKFHNFIADATAGNGSIYNPIPSATIRYSGQLVTGPNVDAPQGTFQSDKQLRADATFTAGRNIFKFGGSMNRIESAAFAAFFGLAPRITESKSTLLAGTVTASNPNGLGCNGVVGAAACPGDPINGYDASSVVLGNGLGFSTAEKGFGLNGGAGSAWRGAAYFGDTIKLTPSLTMTAGLRWSIDTNRENNDLAPPTCAQLAANLAAACGGQSASTSLFALYNPTYTGSVKQPYKNFSPQIGLNYSPGDHKTSLRAGFGIFYESVVFNNTSNARSDLLQSGLFFGDLATTCSTFTLTYPDGTVHMNSPDGTLIKTLCQQRTVAQSAPQFVALQQQYQGIAAANPSSNGSYFGTTLNGGGLYEPNYKQPYSEQYNFGVQREVFKGAVLSVDYVHNSTLKIGQTLDVNHIGAARNFNLANAKTAVTTTLTACGAGATVASAVQPGGCQGLHPTKGAVIGSGATLNDFAGNGLDSSNVYVGASPYAYAGKPNAGAFTGNNVNLGSGAFIQPIGRSGYDALQIVFRQQMAHPLPFIERSNMQISYQKSRIVSTSGSSDEFFSNAVFDNDNPAQFLGRNVLDHSNQVNVSGSFAIKYGPQVGLVGHFYSAAPSTLSLDTEQTKGGIFQTDITGDGTVGDVAPGTVPGDYMHRVNGNSIQSYINNFNSTYAGRLTPAGQQVVNSGLFTQGQLTQIGGAVQPIASLPQATGLNNPTFRNMDLNVFYPIGRSLLHFLPESVSLVPGIAFYNVANLANYSPSQSGVLLNTVSAGGTLNTPGAINAAATGITGTNDFPTLSAGRTQRGSGTFDQGAPRSTEFQLKLNF